MQYYLALKIHDLCSIEKTCRKLKCVLLSERSQSEKVRYCRIPTILPYRKSETMKTGKRSVVAGVKGKGRMNSQENRGFLGQRKSSVRYSNGEYMPLFKTCRMYYTKRRP